MKGLQHAVILLSNFFGVSMPSCTLCNQVEMWATQVLLAVSHLAALTASTCTSSDFPSSGNGLWFTKPAESWASEWLPVGNGYLAGNYSIFFCFLMLTIGKQWCLAEHGMKPHS